MTEDRLSVQSETGRITVKLIATALGGVLVAASFVAQWTFPEALRVDEGISRPLLTRAVAYGMQVKRYG